MQTYNRVTEVLFPFSGLTKVDPEVLQRAGDRGRRVHDAIEAIIDEMPADEIDDEISGYLKSFSAWNVGKTYITRPERFYCDTLRITGECDAIRIDENGKLILVDFKSSYSEGKTWRLQGSAYSHLAKQQGLLIDKIEFVKLPKTGGKAKVFEYKEDMKTFVKCLEVYREFFEGKYESCDCYFL